MSVNMDMTNETADYSDFEYQSVNVNIQLLENVDSTGSTNANGRVVSEIEPLGGIGGLSNNEVAELVALETSAYVEVEDETGDQDVATSVEFRGVVGANLPTSQDGPFITGGNGDTTVVFASNIDESNVNGNIEGNRVEDRFFQHFDAHAGLPFDDESSGPGGSFASNGFHNLKNFRDMVGRGPVLDSNDNVGISKALILGDSTLEVKGLVRCHMVWDVAEVDDAGRAFSVPE